MGDWWDPQTLQASNENECWRSAVCLGQTAHVNMNVGFRRGKRMENLNVWECDNIEEFQKVMQNHCYFMNSLNHKNITE